MRYFDSSALVKRYVRETGSVKVQRLLSSGPAATSRYSAVEIASALARRTLEGALLASDRERALAVLREDMAALLVVELTDEVVTRAQALLLSHPLRGGDAVQLASCVHLREQLGADVRLIAFWPFSAIASRR